ncbi:dephospho-CoA kinase [Gracilibacillus thailandensis]|uniref:Dephospho-CoA kinase n=1 Tax=Gracilibacillus thailandensis TaxID=563735 RepID=A0A6N7R2K5_9BACI|nr:dephospho-CoA kinase [Gracilibacillus thailandensis]MRI65266.1 dephospho-CoA kinase [Gracilibacillus thailandensis]
MKELIIGLTGNIATGKSTISNMIQEKYQIPVIDADIVSREVVEPGEQALKKIAATFGEEILLEDGTLNRKLLGSIIFQDQSKREQLNAIVHPAVRKRMISKKEKLLQQGYRSIVMDIPLLFENNLTYLVEKTIVVYTTEDVQLQRLIKRNDLTEKEARDRMNSQMNIEEKRELADAVIDNSGSIEESEIQLINILKKWELIN